MRSKWDLAASGGGSTNCYLRLTVGNDSYKETYVY